MEYVSDSDYFQLGGPASNSSVQDYDFKDVANGVAKAVEKKGPDVYFGTVYDPMPRVDWRQFKDEKDPYIRFERMQIQGRTEAKRLLRLQVKDFIDWLKGQGVI